MKCPRCGKEYVGFPAISRRDNKTEICSSCGVAEAMFDYKMAVNRNIAKGLILAEKKWLTTPQKSKKEK